MNNLAKAMNDTFGGGTKVSDEQLRARCLEQLDRCLRIIRELERPEFRRFVEFALMWGNIERRIEKIQRMLDEHSGEKAAHPFDELFAQLVKN